MRHTEAGALLPLRTPGVPWFADNQKNVLGRLVPKITTTHDRERDLWGPKSVVEQVFEPARFVRPIDTMPGGQVYKAPEGSAFALTPRQDRANNRITHQVIAGELYVNGRPYAGYHGE